MSFLDYYLLGTPPKKKLVLKGEKAVEEFECAPVSRPLTTEELERMVSLQREASTPRKDDKQDKNDALLLVFVCACVLALIAFITR